MKGWFGLTSDSNKNISCGWASNAIVSSTSVASFILFTSDVQRHGDNTVIRKSFPGNNWCWKTISSTVECQCICVIHCYVTRNADAWRICKRIKGAK